MKNLFAVLTAVFLTFGPTACEDSSSLPNDSDLMVSDSQGTLDSLQDLDQEDSSDQSDDLASQEVKDESSDDAEVLEEQDVAKETLPSDPTEDPEGESSFYEFPAWHIPASN